MREVSSPCQRSFPVGYFHSPLELEGFKCFNDGFILNTTCPMNLCNFSGPKCVTNNGQIIENTYTDYYVTCNDGVISYPLPVGPGLRCYNGEGVVAPEEPPSPDGDDSCNFLGIRCIDTFGIFKGVVPGILQNLH